MPAMTHPFLLQRFLKESGWPTPANAAIAHNMQTALSFFSKRLAKWIDVPLDAHDKGYRTHGPNPLGFSMSGKVTKLTSAMQSIDFHHLVSSIDLIVGRKIRRYGGSNEPRGGPAPGLWYTDPEVPAFTLALPPGQTTAFSYEVVAQVTVLRCTAGDMLVDWGMKLAQSSHPLQDVDYHYRVGGGIQYVIPSASRFLRPL